MITQAQLAVSTDVRQRALLICQPVKQLVPDSNQVVVDRVAFVGVAAVVAHGKNIYIYYFINHTLTTKCLFCSFCNTKSQSPFYSATSIFAILRKLV